MKEIFLLNDAIISPLGFTTAENIKAIREGRSGLEKHQIGNLKSLDICAGIINTEKLTSEFNKIGNPSHYTRLEQMMILAVSKVLSEKPNPDLQETALIVSTTKGNIDLLNSTADFSSERVELAVLGKALQEFFGFKQKPYVLSNACISGGLALAVAKRFINQGRFKNAVVVGGDLVSEFVVSGFNSFQALSPEQCRPFSAKRDGINLGEAAAAILVSSEKEENSTNIRLIGEASANDANHISGPSRTGEGLYKSISKAMESAGVSSEEIDFLSAHGTATLYNDEMEAIAFSRAGLEQVPVNSLKGYYGHTLGASALIESIITKHSLQNNELYVSLNFDESGVSKPLNLIQVFQKKELYTALKTASGFGGCNLALVFRKE